MEPRRHLLPFKSYFASIFHRELCTPPLGGVNTPRFLYDTPQVSASWGGVLGGVYQGVFLGGGSAAQLVIRGVFREVVCTEFGLRTYSPVVLVCLHHRGMHKQVVQPSQNRCLIYLQAS